MNRPLGHIKSLRSPKGVRRAPGFAQGGKNWQAFWIPALASSLFLVYLTKNLVPAVFFRVFFWPFFCGFCRFFGPCRLSFGGSPGPFCRRRGGVFPPRFFFSPFSFFFPLPPSVPRARARLCPGINYERPAPGGPLPRRWANDVFLLGLSCFFPSLVPRSPAPWGYQGYRRPIWGKEKSPRNAGVG